MTLKFKILYLFIIYIILILLPNSLKAQTSNSMNFQATYRLLYQTTKVEDRLNQENMLLFISPGFTKFLSVGKHKKDSLLRNKKNAGSSLSQLLRNLPKTDFDYVIINELNDSKIVYHQKILKDNFSYEESPTFNWEISKEKKEVSGYSCQKAITDYGGRKYTAWFASEIPVSSGPYKFGGLPGLIIEISDTDNDYNFKLIELKKLDDSILLDNDPNTIKTEKDIFLKILKEYEENPLKKMEQAGIKIDFPDNSKKMEMLKEHKEKLQERNPIELTEK